jgi:DNA/RNA-binding domain of Phe-tRNA-synthetase-like protein
MEYGLKRPTGGRLAVMNALHYSIADEVFQRFPGYLRGVVIAHEVSNCPSPDALVQMLRDAEASVRDRLSLERLADEPRIRSWREAYRAFGAKPSEFRSSIEALARRALRSEPLPSINALVDIDTVVSLRHLIPVGGHAIDVLTGDIALRLASGQEQFTPFGSDQTEHPLPGEVVFAEGDTVLTRRWTWRQATHTLTLLTTRGTEFNVDGLPPVPRSEVDQACRDITEPVTQFCGGRLRSEVLSRNNPRIEFAP